MQSFGKYKIKMLSEYFKQLFTIFNKTLFIFIKWLTQ